MQEGIRKLNSQYIYESVKREITYMVLRPGEEISILALSERLLVSRSPVRDALMRLQDEGLVDMLPQRGCWVSLIDYKRVWEELLLRLSLELTAIERLAREEKESYYKEMEFLIELQKEAISEADAVSYFEADDKMHEVYFRAANVPSFWSVIVRETGNYRRMRVLSFFAEGIASLNIEQHEMLLSAFRRKDWAFSKQILTSHLKKLEEEKKKITDKYPQYFKEELK